MGSKRNVLVQVLKDCEVLDNNANPVKLEAMQVYHFSYFDEHDRHANGVVENFGWIYRLMPGTYQIVSEGEQSTEPEPKNTE